MIAQTITAAAALAAAGAASAQLVEFDFFGNAGFGILPGNEIGGATPVALGVTSDAFGDEIGDGLVFDTDTNILSFSFEFEGLDGGLFDAATGIHFHLIEGSTDPFNETGPIVFNLNNGVDPNVTLETPLIAVDGSATSGTVTGTAQLTADQAEELFAGNFYLNIHSGDFTGGNIRGNIVVPSPAPAAALGLAGLVAARRRRA